jgi:hypothetical protein
MTAGVSFHLIILAMQSYLRRPIALPQDHGSWVFILSPLLVGLFAGGRFSAASLALVLAAMAAFLIRQPVTMAVKAYAGRRPRTDLPAARFWIVVYGMVILLSLGYLIARGFTYVLFLAVPGVPVFAWHLVLVSKRAERRQAGVEILATGVLALAAPAAFWVGLGHYAAEGWWLWLWTWLQSSGSIVYAYLRLEQREQAKVQRRSEAWRGGQRAFLYTSFNLTLALIFGWTRLQPQWIFLPFLIQWVETVWGVTHPAAGWKPTAIGIRQLIVSTLWTILFILCWR